MSHPILAVPTRKSWLNQALDHWDEVLLDHAHCEKKAASSALGFLFRYPEHASWMRIFSELAREELRHFEQVLRRLDERGIPFVRQVPSQYAPQLIRHCSKDEPNRKLDLLLCSALIEARSCERMTILSEALRDFDASLSQFYRGLLACEARHYETYISMANEVFDAHMVQQRLHELAAFESEILSVEGERVRLHS